MKIVIKKPSVQANQPEPSPAGSRDVSETKSRSPLSSSAAPDSAPVVSAPVSVVVKAPHSTANSAPASAPGGVVNAPHSTAPSAPLRAATLTCSSSRRSTRANSSKRQHSAAPNSVTATHTEPELWGQSTWQRTRQWQRRVGSLTSRGKCAGCLVTAYESAVTRRLRGCLVTADLRSVLITAPLLVTARLTRVTPRDAPQAMAVARTARRPPSRPTRSRWYVAVKRVIHPPAVRTRRAPHISIRRPDPMSAWA